MMNDIVARFRERMIYCPETGKLYWKERLDDGTSYRNTIKGWNKRYAWKEAFTAGCGAGYKQGVVDNISYRAHTVCWAIHYGEYLLYVDHINTNRNDNRISNLRKACPEGNAQNRGRNSNNLSGYKGVSWSKEKKRWLAYIGEDHGVEDDQSACENIAKAIRKGDAS